MEGLGPVHGPVNLGRPRAPADFCWTMEEEQLLWTEGGSVKSP